jgi:hypothetical protein
VLQLFLLLERLQSVEVECGQKDSHEECGAGESADSTTRCGIDAFLAVDLVA